MDAARILLQAMIVIQRNDVVFQRGGGLHLFGLGCVRLDVARFALVVARQSHICFGLSDLALPTAAIADPFTSFHHGVGIAITHDGNQAYRGEVVLRAQRYSQARTNAERNRVAREIVHWVELEQDGRFLIRDPRQNAVWLANDADKMRKVKAAFRDVIRRNAPPAAPVVFVAPAPAAVVAVPAAVDDDDDFQQGDEVAHAVGFWLQDLEAASLNDGEDPIPLDLAWAEEGHQPPVGAGGRWGELPVAIAVDFEHFQLPAAPEDPLLGEALHVEDEGMMDWHLV
jgi:hypothetical protein